jgi:hypothetical protein
LSQSLFRDYSVFCEIWVVSNRNKKTEGGLSHPTDKNDRVQIVDDDNDLTVDGKHSVATQWINAGVFYGNTLEFEFLD